MTELAHLSGEGRLVLRSLRDHPHLTSAHAIAEGPAATGQLDADDVGRAFVELEGFGLAVEQASGGTGDWRLTAEGRELARLA